MDAYAAAPRAAGRTPWRQARFCVVDLETTGLDPGRDEIVAWSAVPVDAGRIALGEARHGLVRPATPPARDSVVIHGLRGADLAGAPPLAEATDALLTAMTARVLVAHAAWVEEAFLARALGPRGARLPCWIVDTDALGRLWLGERDGRAPRTLPLAALAGELGLPVHRPHTADGDALTTAQAFLALAAHLDALTGPQTVRSLARAAHLLRTSRAYARFG